MERLEYLRQFNPIWTIMNELISLVKFSKSKIFCHIFVKKAILATSYFNPVILRLDSRPGDLAGPH